MALIVQKLGGASVGSRGRVRNWFGVPIGVLLSFALAGAMAQAPQQLVTEEPAFEIRRFIFDGAASLPAELLEEVTRPFTGKSRKFSDIQQALEALEALERIYTATWP